MSKKGFLIVFLVVFTSAVLILVGVWGLRYETTLGLQGAERITVDMAWSLVDDHAKLYGYLKEIAPPSCDPSNRVVTLFRGEGSSVLAFEVMRINPRSYEINSSGEIWQKTQRVDLRPDLHKSKPGDQLVLWMLMFQKGGVKEECNFVVNETRGTYVPLIVVQHL